MRNQSVKATCQRRQSQNEGQWHLILGSHFCLTARVQSYLGARIRFFFKYSTWAEGLGPHLDRAFYFRYAQISNCGRILTRFDIEGRSDQSIFANNVRADECGSSTKSCRLWPSRLFGVFHLGALYEGALREDAVQALRIKAHLTRIQLCWYTF